jgi:hypothetical protein
VEFIKNFIPFFQLEVPVVDRKLQCDVLSTGV